jgi:hypothetical protein
MHRVFELKPNRFVRVMLAFAVCCGLFGRNFQRVASAAESQIAAALELVPDEALGAVVFNRFDDVNKPMIKAAMNLNWALSAPHVVAIQLLQSRTGRNDQGVAVLVVLPPIFNQSSFPLVAVAIPVTDYEKYIANFSTLELEDGYRRVLSFDPKYAHIKDIADSGAIIWTIRKGNYALLLFQPGIVSESSEAQREMRTRAKKLLVDRPARMTAAIADAKDWLARQDIGVIVTDAGVNRSMSMAQSRVKQFKATSEQIALYASIFASIEKEVSQFAAGVQVDDDLTIRVAGRTKFVDEGNWKKLASKLPAPGGAPLAGLPGEPYLALFEGAFPSEGSGLLIDYSMQMLKMAAGSTESKLTDDDWKRLRQAMAKSVQEVRSMSVKLGVPKAGESLCDAMTGLIKVEDSAKYVDRYAQSIAAIREIAAATKNSFLGKYESKLTNVDGSPTLEVTMDYSETIAVSAKQPGGTTRKAYLEMLLGATGKANIYLQAVDKNTVIAAWSDKANLARTRATAESLTEGLAKNAGVQSTAAMLPKGSQWTIFVSPTGAISSLESLAQTLGATGLPALPKLGEVPPLGFAALLDADTLEWELVVPEATVNGVSKAMQRP